VHAENSAIYLPGQAKEHGLADTDYAWPCVMDKTAQWRLQNTGLANPMSGQIDYLTHYQWSSRDVTKIPFLSIGGLYRQKSEDGKLCEWKVDTVDYKSDIYEGGVQYIPFQSLLPSFPMAKVQTKEHQSQVEKFMGSKPEIGSSAPDIVGFFLQWANCKDIVLQMICDEYDSPFKLGDGVYLTDAAEGVLARYREWAERGDSAEEKLEAAAQKLGYGGWKAAAAFPDGKAPPKMSTPKAVIQFLQQYLPSASDSYMFQASKAPVHYDPYHPLALCNLNCHYQHWVMKCLDIMNGKQYPTMGMIRAYALSDDTFRRSARKMKSAGMFYQWPAGPLMRLNAREKGVKLVTDRDAVEEAMKKFTVPERIAFLARFVFDVVINVKLKLRAAAASLEGKPGKKDSMKKFEAAVQELIKDHQPYLFLFLDYASRMAGKQARAEELGFGMDAEDDESKKLPKDLEGYEVFADPVMGQTLSVTIASGTWVTHTLYRAPHKFGKSNARGISDADIQLMLAAADKHGLDKDFAIRLQKRIAQTHDDVFVNASILDGMCKHIKGQSIEMYDVQTQQPVPSDMWKWSEVGSDGARSLELTDAGKKKYGDNWRERLVPDCKHLMMVFPDDAMNPQILPHPPMSGEAVFRFLERAKQTDAGNNLFMKIQKRYQKVEPHTVIEAAKGAYESSNPYRAKIAATRSRSDRRHWSGPVSNAKEETL
jgi:hypothetical protein